MRAANPNEDVLRAADRIILIDPNRPDWLQPLYSSFMLRPETTVEILVDSTDAATIQQWRDRINALNLND